MVDVRFNLHCIQCFFPLSAPIPHLVALFLDGRATISRHGHAIRLLHERFSSTVFDEFGLAGIAERARCNMEFIWINSARTHTHENKQSRIVLNVAHSKRVFFSGVEREGECVPVKIFRFWGETRVRANWAKKKQARTTLQNMQTRTQIARVCESIDNTVPLDELFASSPSK